jgi:hypothetical protein
VSVLLILPQVYAHDVHEGTYWLKVTRQGTVRWQAVVQDLTLDFIVAIETTMRWKVPTGIQLAGCSGGTG